MMLDIIHPRNQGQDPELGFIEPWAERKARRLPSLKPKEAQPPSNSLITNPTFRRRVIEMRTSGFTVKRMAMELQCDPRTIGRAEQAYKLGPRIRTRGKTDIVNFKFDLPYGLYKAMNQHWVGRYRSASHFLRTVLQARLDAEAAAQGGGAAG